MASLGSMLVPAGNAKIEQKSFAFGGQNHQNKANMESHK